jgi:hypothetical protein
MFPWLYAQKPKAITSRDVMLERLRNGVPLALAERAAGVSEHPVHENLEIDMALAEGEILLFERARDSGVTGVVRAALRNETKSWVPKAEANLGLSLEDYLRD